MESFAVSIAEFTGVDTSGSNGAGAIAQSASGTTGAGTTSWAPCTLAAFASSNDRPYCVYGAADSTLDIVAPEAGWTELHEIEGATNPTWVKCAAHWNPNAVDTTPTATGTAVAMGGIAVEIVAAAPTSSSPDTTASAAAALYYYS